MSKTTAISESKQQEAEPSKRYRQLLEVINKCLLESRNTFATDDAIEVCYGDDATMFEDEDNNFLASAIDAMVHRVNSNVRAEMLEFLKTERIQERLDAVENIVNQLDQEDRDQREADAEDRQSARGALAAARLPKDVSPADVLRHQSFNLMQKERDTLTETLSEVEFEVEELDKRIAQCTSQLSVGVQNLRQVRQDLRKSVAMLADSKTCE